MNMLTRLRIAWADARERKKLYRLYSQMGAVGRNVHFCPGYDISAPQNVTLGSHIWVGPDFFVRAEGGLTIGSGTIISRCCEIWTVNHNYDSDDLEAIPYDRRFVPKEVTIGENVWIGSRAILLPGAVIGEGAVISAGSVVSGRMPDFAVCGGNPARVIKYRNIEKYRELKAENRIYLDLEYDYDKSTLRKSEY